MTSAPLVSEVIDALRKEGSLSQYGEGPFLLEIPVQSPSPSPGAPVDTAAGTKSLNRDVLLGLKRARGSDGARLFALGHGATLGRSSACALAIGDETLSKDHARFERLGSSWHVEDLQSENGTFVSGKRVKRDPVFLRDLDVLQVGKLRFAFVTAHDLARLLTPVASSDALDVARLTTELEALGSRRFLDRYHCPCLLLAYRTKGQSSSEFAPTSMFPLVGEGPLTIGRSKAADLTLADKRVSKTHARITPIGDERSEVEDAGASNPTVVNGRRLAAGEKATLSPWDSVSFGPGVWGLYLSPRGLVENLAELRRKG